MPPTPGERFCQHVSEYLIAHQLKSLGQIDRKQLASIYDDFQKKEKPARKACLKPEGVGLGETDESWIASLSASPAYEGIDAPREIEKCRNWSRINRKPFTKRRVVNWLNRIEVPMRNSSGANGFPMASAKPIPEPQCWRDFLNDNYPDNCHRETAWVNLPDHAKKLVLQGMNK